MSGLLGKFTGDELRAALEEHGHRDGVLPPDARSPLGARYTLDTFQCGEEDLESVDWTGVDPGKAMLLDRWFRFHRGLPSILPGPPTLGRRVLTEIMRERYATARQEIERGETPLALYDSEDDPFLVSPRRP